MANHLRAGVLVVVCLSAPMSVAAQSAYSDDFEATTVNAFWTSTMQQNGTVALSTDQNHTSSGVRSMKFASASGGQREMHLTHTFSAPTKGTFSVWYYDYAPGQQTLYEKINLNNSITGDGASIGTMDYDAYCYTAQLWDASASANYGPNANCGSFPQVTTTNVSRTAGWHQFAITISASGISFAIDGSSLFSRSGNYSFDSVDLFISGPSWRPNTVAYFDDFSFVPDLTYTDDFEPSTLNAFWGRTQQYGTVALSTDQNHTTSGARGVKFASTTGGQREMHLTHHFTAAVTGTFSIWFYDYAPGSQTLYEKLTLSNSSTGDGAGIGVEDYDASCYTATLYVASANSNYGPNANCGSYPQVTTSNVSRTSGWHHFVITVTSTALSLAIDGTTVFSTSGSYSFDGIDILVSGPYWRPDTVAYIDDFSYVP